VAIITPGGFAVAISREWLLEAVLQVPAFQYEGDKARMQGIVTWRPAGQEVLLHAMQKQCSAFQLPGGQQSPLDFQLFVPNLGPKYTTSSGLHGTDITMPGEHGSMCSCSHAYACCALCTVDCTGVLDSLHGHPDFDCWVVSMVMSMVPARSCVQVSTIMASPWCYASLPLSGLQQTLVSSWPCAALLATAPLRW
jgi:hypothetical protein